MQVLEAPQPTRMHVATEFSAQTEKGAQSILTDAASNLYVSPTLKALFQQQGITASPGMYGVPGPAVLYAARLPTNDKGFLTKEGKLIFDVADVVSSTKAVQLALPQFPEVATYMSGANIVIGVVGCYDKLSRPGIRKRIGGGFCFADILAKILLALGPYIPGLQNFSSYLIGVQIFVKLGDTVAEYHFRGSEPTGQVILKSISLDDLSVTSLERAVVVLGDKVPPSSSVPATTPERSS